MLRKYPYLCAVVISTLIAVVVWIFIPKEYAAQTRLSDEYKEMDLAVGLNKIQARLNKAKNLGNSGISDMEVYCKVLKTDEFAIVISRKMVPQKGITYGEYLGKSDTIASILANIEYNYSNKKDILDIQFRDKDPYVAYVMLDSVVSELQSRIIEAKHTVLEAQLNVSKKNKEKALEDYNKAYRTYAQFVDSNEDVATYTIKTQADYLKADADRAFKNYQDANKKYVREFLLLQRSSIAFAIVKPNTLPQKPLGSIWLYISAFVFLAVVLVWCIRLYKTRPLHNVKINLGNIFSPWNITLLIWLTVMAFIYVLKDALYPLTEQFYVAITLWLVFFCVSSFVVYNLYENSSIREEKNKTEINVNKYIFISLLAISVILTPLCVKKVIEVVTMFDSENMMQNIRTLAVKGEGFGAIDLCFVINKVLFIVVLWRYPKISFWWVLVITLLMLMNSFAVMDKGTIFYLLSAVMFVMYERGKIKLYHMGMAMGVIVALFFVLTIMRSGTDSSGESNLGDLTLVEFIGMYVLANPVAFGYMNQGVDTQVGSNTFFLLYYYLNRFGLGHYDLINIGQEFSWVPIPTNLYTIMQPFFVDFGYIGVAFFAVVYGVMSGWAYGAYKKGSDMGKVIYTYLFFVLILQFGQEQIFMAPVLFMRVVVLFFLLTQQRIRISYAPQKNNIRKP